jgi:hypothetical protein
VQAAHGPADLTWTAAAAALSMATGVPIEALLITDDEQRSVMREAGMSEVAVEGIVGKGGGQARRFHTRNSRARC